MVKNFTNKGIRDIRQMFTEIGRLWDGYYWFERAGNSDQLVDPVSKEEQFSLAKFAYEYLRDFENQFKDPQERLKAMRNAWFQKTFLKAMSKAAHKVKGTGFIPVHHQERRKGDGFGRCIGLHLHSKVAGKGSPQGTLLYKCYEGGGFTVEIVVSSRGVAHDTLHMEFDGNRTHTLSMDIKYAAFQATRALWLNVEHLHKDYQHGGLNNTAYIQYVGAMLDKIGKDDYAYK